MRSARDCMYERFWYDSYVTGSGYRKIVGTRDRLDFSRNQFVERVIEKRFGVAVFSAYWIEPVTILGT